MQDTLSPVAPKRNNYINTLQAENADLRGKLNEIEEWRAAFVRHLHSEKFRGTEGGERKDWIATGDVLAQLQNLWRLLL
jgi:hypothetical protein